MDRLLTLDVFRRVAQRRSFSAAARELQLSNAAVSKHVAALEDRVRARLLHRTTRRVSLTPAGEAYLERCTRILDDLDELDAQALRATTTLKGTLRVNAPLSFGLLHVSPLIPVMVERWPELRLELALTDQFVDLVEEGVDVAVRIARTLPDTTTLVAQRLASVGYALCASQAYLERRGVPRTPADLADHDCIVSGPSEWTFARGGREVRVAPDGKLSINNSLAIRDAVVAGVGISVLPRFYVHDLLRAKQLRALLAGHEIPPAHVYAVYARQRNLSTKIRAFIDFLRDHLAVAPWAA